jgi:hypothetical protein
VGSCHKIAPGPRSRMQFMESWCKNCAAIFMKLCTACRVCTGWPTACKWFTSTPYVASLHGQIIRCDVTPSPFFVHLVLLGVALTRMPVCTSTRMTTIVPLCVHDTRTRLLRMQSTCMQAHAWHTEGVLLFPRCGRRGCQHHSIQQGSLACGTSGRTQTLRRWGRRVRHSTRRGPTQRAL